MRIRMNFFVFVFSLTLLSQFTYGLKVTYPSTVFVSDNFDISIYSENLTRISVTLDGKTILYRTPHGEFNTTITTYVEEEGKHQLIIEFEENGIYQKWVKSITATRFGKNITNIREYISRHEAEWKKDEVGGGISLHTVERWFKETWQSVIEWVESKVNWLLEKVSDLLEWRDEANTKLAELEARVRYLERVCEKLMEAREQEKYEDIVAVMVENNLSELRVGNAVCEVEENKYVCIERLK